MKTKRKILWASCAVVLLLVCISGGLIWYAYSHPLLIKTWVEKWVSRSTGATLTIGKLEYSVDPLRIQAKGVRFTPGEKLRGFDLYLPDVSAEFFLEGSFGNRVLVCKSITLPSFSGRMGADATLFQGDDSSFISSSSGGILSRLISIFLFRDIKIQQIAIANGQMDVEAGDLNIRLNKIQSNLNAKHAVELLCSIHAEWPVKKMKLTIPLVSLKTDGPVSLGDSGTRFRLNLENGGLESPEGIVHDLSVKANLLYQYPLGRVAFTGLTVGFREAVLGGENEKREILSACSLTADGKIDLKNRSLRVNPMALDVADLLHLKGKLDADLGAPRRFQLEVSQGRAFPGRLLPFVDEKISPFSTTISGPVSLSGAVNGFEESGKWGWECGLNATFEENRGFRCGGRKTVSGKTFRGSKSGWAVSPSQGDRPSNMSGMPRFRATGSCCHPLRPPFP